MKKLLIIVSVVLTTFGSSNLFGQGQNCLKAELLCTNVPLKVDAKTTNSSAAFLPADICGAAVTRACWFRIVANKVGGAVKITFSNVLVTNPLDVGVFTGNCAALVAVPDVTGCGAGLSGTFDIDFIAAADTEYFIAIDDQGSAQISDFSIIATGAAIIRPNGPSYIFAPVNQCYTDPSVDVVFTNNYADSLLAGDSLKLYYNFDFAANPNDWTYITSKSYTHQYTATGRYSPFMSATNECTSSDPDDGTKTFLTQVIVADLMPAIEATDTFPDPDDTAPPFRCGFSIIKLKGTATETPSPPPAIPFPYDSAYVTEWRFDYTDDGVYDTIIKFGDTGFNRDSFVVWFDYSTLGIPPPYTVKLYVDGQCGPDSSTMELSSDTFTVNVTPKVQMFCQGDLASLQPLDTACVFTCVTTVMPLPPLTFRWTEVPSVTPGVTIDFPDSNWTSLTIPPTLTDTLYFELLVMDGTLPDFCSNRDTAMIIINPRPVATLLDRIGFVCPYYPVPFDNVITNVLGDTVVVSGGTPYKSTLRDPYDFLWDPTTGLSSSTIQNPIATLDATTSFTLMITDSLGCDTISNPMEVYVFPKPSADPVPPQLCITDVPLEATFTINWPSGPFDIPMGPHPGVNPNDSTINPSVNEPPNFAMDTVWWATSPDYALLEKPVDDGITTPGVTMDSIIAVADFTPVGVGIYNFEFISHNASTGCRDTVQGSYSVYDTITVTEVTVTKDTVCVGDSSNLAVVFNIAKTPPSQPTFLWSSVPFDMSLIGQSTDPNPWVKPAAQGQWTVYTVRMENGDSDCFDTMTDSVYVNPTPTAVAIAVPPIICEVPDTIRLDGTGSTAAGVNYLWKSMNPASTSTFLTKADSIITSVEVLATDSFRLYVGDLANGCVDSIRVDVVLAPIPNAVADAQPDTVCSGGPGTLVNLSGTGSDVALGTTYLWTANPVTAITNDTQIDASATISTRTIFTLTVTNVEGCDSTVTDSVEVFPIPTISAFPPSVCLEVLDSTQLWVVGEDEASGLTTYDWSGSPAVATLTSTNTDTVTAKFVLSSLTAYDYSVIVTDGRTGCVNTLTLDDFPVLDSVDLVMPVDAIICEGDSLEIIVTGAADYTWVSEPVDGSLSGPEVTNDTIVVAPVAVGGVPTTYLYIVTGTAGVSGCSDIDTIEVTVNPKPISTFTAGSPICVGLSSTITYTGVIDATSTYNWDFDGGVPAPVVVNPGGAGPFDVTWPTKGTKTVKLMVNSAVNCPSDTTEVPVVLDEVDLVLPLDPTICEGDSVEIVVSGALTYAWVSEPVDGSLAGPEVTNDTIVVAPVAVGGIMTTYLYIVTGSAGVSGCTKVDTVKVNVNPKPLSTFTTGSPICTGASSTITYTGVYDATSTYNWDFGGGTPVPAVINPGGAGPFEVTWPALGTKTVKLMVNPTTACQSDTTTMTVEVHNVPGVDFTLPPPICTNVVSGNITFTGVPAPGPNAVYNWDFGLDALPATITTGGPHNVVWSTPGSKTITLSVTDSGCTSAIVTKSLQINGLPVVAIQGGVDNLATCDGSDITLYAGSYVPTPNTYQWTDNNATIVGVPATQDTLTFTVNPATIGNYVVQVTDANGCTASDNVTIAISATLPVVIITNPGTGVICQGDVLNLNAGSFTPVTQYAWTPNNETSQTINVTVADTYTVSVTDGKGCTGSATITPTVNTKPTSDFTLAGSGCVNSPDVITYTGNASAGATYTWNFGGGNAIPAGGQGPINIDWATAGAQAVTLTVAENGCTSTLTTRNITINPIPVANIGIDLAGPYCSGATVNLTGPAGMTNYLWTPDGTNTIATPTAANTAATINANGTIKLNVTDANGCVSKDSTINVAIFAAPTTTGDAFCIGTTGTLTASGGTAWLWSNGPIVGLNTNQTVTVNPTSTTIYNVNITYNAGACTIDLPVTATVMTPNITQGQPRITSCTTDPLTITVDGVSLTDFSWRSEPPGFSSTAQSPSVTPPATVGDSIVFICSIKDINGCFGADTVTVIRTDQIIANAGINETVCIIEGGCVNYTLTGGASTGQTVTWTSPTVAPNTWTIANPTVCMPVTDPFNPPSYQFNLTTTSPNCPVEKDSVVIDFVPYQKPDAGGPYMICAGPVQLFGTGGINIITWTAITPGAVILSGASTAQPIVNESATQDTSKFVFSTTNTTTGCTATDTAFVIKQGSITPSLTILPAANVCIGVPITLTSSGGNNYTYYENNVIVQDGAQTTYTTTHGVAGSFQYKVVVTATGCVPVTSTPLTLTVSPNPITLVSRPVTACQGVDLQMALDPTTTATNFIWSPGTLFNDSTSNQPLLLNPTFGSVYNVTLTGTSAQGCPGTDNISISVNTKPVSFPGSNAIICPGDPVQLGASPDPGFSYAWSPQTALSDPAIANPIALVSANATYTLTKTETATGCSHDSSVTISMGTPPSPLVASDLDTIRMCVNTTFTVTDAQVPTDASNIIWVAPNQLILTNAQTTQPTIQSSPTTGLFNLVLFVTSADGCTKSDTVPVKVFFPAVADFVADTICAGKTTTFKDNSSDAFSWSWDFGDSNSTTDTSDQQNPSYTYADGGVHTASLLINRGTDCQSVMTKQVLVFGRPNAGFTYTSDNFPEYVFTNNTQGLVGDENVTWDFGDGSPTSSELNPKHTFTYVQDQGFRVSLLIVNKNGCIDSFSVVIDVGVEAPTQIPNVYSPDGDGINDNFFIKGIEVFQNSRMTIFNRWGNEVFKTDNYKNDWDAKGISAGVYFWILEYNYKERGVKKGWVTVVK